MLGSPSRKFLKANLFVFAAIFGLAFSLGPKAYGQNNGGNNGFFFNRVIGGVQVDPNGVLSSNAQRLPESDKSELLVAAKKAEQGLSEIGLRCVSVSAIEAAMENAAENNTAIPFDIQFLCGLQRIEYVIVTDNDVLLAGPGEGLTIAENGQVVGSKSGMPTLKLEDLIVAMQTVDNAREGYGISVDISPTAEGVERHQRLIRQLGGDFNSSVATQLEEAMGEQAITLTGVPGESHYAQILAAADYHMKRISMGFEAAPISNFPSYLELVQQNGSVRNSEPRFWMECSYDAIAKSDDGRVWQINGSGVKTLTEEGVFAKTGGDKKVKKNKLAEKWADSMTERFEELASADPLFRELRNVMDLSVVAALIAKEGLLGQGNVSAPILTDKNPSFATPVWNVPKKVASQCSFVRVTNGWAVSTSGGVQVDSWSVVANQKTDSALNDFGSKFEMAKGQVWSAAN
ncbi:MAG: DUF1598 domain-containing protein [Pirellulaceae bacterium]